MQYAASERSHLFRGARKAHALFAVAVAAMLLATLWPFNPRPRNAVTWLQEGNGLKFERAGMVISSGPRRFPDHVQSFTLEMLE